MLTLAPRLAGGLRPPFADAGPSAPAGKNASLSTPTSGAAALASCSGSTSLQRMRTFCLGDDVVISADGPAVAPEARL